MLDRYEKNVTIERIMGVSERKKDGAESQLVLELTDGDPDKYDRP